MGASKQGILSGGLEGNQLDFILMAGQASDVVQPAEVVCCDQRLLSEH
ncbi:MAG: hypothetical protein ACXVNF_13195 [Neobacillus sp.]